MRKLIVTALMSLDGYVSGEHGDFMVMPVDESFSEYNVERERAASTLLFGGTTYRGMLAYWPSIEHDAAQPEIEREISRCNNRHQKVAVSDTLTAEETGVWRDTTEIVRRADAHHRIAELKREDGGDILVFGSTTLWNDLLAAGLVDELHLQLGAGAIGTGDRAFRAPFGGQFDGDLRLLEARQLPGSQNVLLKYAVTR